LQPGERGAFEVVVDGVLVFSKQAAGRFPDDAEIVAELRRG
jgi:selT/selW/selH-like putative selenoprotein